MDFLVEVTRHNFSSNSEDRLTQVVVAAFNSSLRFKRIFFVFLGIKYDASAKAFSQVNVGNSRPDIKLLGGTQWKRPIAVIESKTESKSGKLQLKNHKSFRAAHHILILKYRERLVGLRRWKVAYWSDLALLVQQEIEHIESSSSFDSVLFRSLVDFFREYGFMKNSIITKKHLESVGTFLNTIRFQKNPRGSLSGISALQDVTEAMELALEMLKVDGSLSRELSEVASIRPSTTMNFTYHYGDIDKLTVKKKRAGSLLKQLNPRARKFLQSEVNELAEHRRHRANTVSLEKSIFLKKQKRNGIRSLNLSIEQVDDRKSEVIVRLAVVNSKGNITTCLDWDRTSLPKGGLTAADIAKEAAKQWAKWLKKKAISW